MNKNRLMIGVVLAVMLVMSPVTSHAGTFMGGVKYWYTWWESGVLDWFEKDLVASFARNGVTITTDTDDGTGYLAGPFISYLSDSGKWSLSFAPMFISSFTQDWEGQGSGMNMQSDVDVDRIDFDLAFNYNLNDYIKLFVGYKYQDIEIDFTLSYTTNLASITNHYTLDERVHMPTVGVGFVYPFLERLVGGLQLGLVYAVPDLELKDSDGATYDIWPHSTFGFNGEVSLNYRPIDQLIIQLGYRYQFFRLDARSPQTWDKTESDDISHGFTASVVWVF